MNQKRNILVVMVGYLHSTPPALTLIQSLCDANFIVSVISAGNNDCYSYPGYKFENVNFINVIGEYSSNISLIRKMTRLFKIRNNIWKVLTSNNHCEDLVIVISEVTIKHLGMRIIERDYIYYQLELIKEINYIPHFNLWHINPSIIANNAKKVIVCEYNRAHITKTWWNMKTLPEVVMNKPYVPAYDIDNIPVNIINIINNIKKFAAGRKIILYQGVISKQRPIRPFIEAALLAKERYCFISISNKSVEIDHSKDCLLNIPFINPPYHLLITELADIGVLAYTSGGSSAYSELNPIYCAPNKVWEYSRYGIPMISNDLPGLNFEFKINGIGLCTDLDPEMILSNYDNIIDNYEDFSEASKKYYSSYNVNKEIIRIVESAL